MRRTWVALIAMPALLVACGSPDRPTAPLGRDAPEGAPEILEVICTADGSTEIVNPRVQAKPDGVHVRFDNRAGEPASLNGTALDFSDGVSEQVAPLAPGRRKVACWPHSKHGGPEPKLFAIEVLDPEGYWRPSDLQCAPGELHSAVMIDYIADAPGKKGDPQDITSKTVNGMEPGDEIRTVEYPEAENRKVAIVRDRKLIAVLSYWPAQNGGWLVGDYSTCESSGISV